MTEVQQVEAQIKVAKEMQALRDAAIVLENNSAFKTVVTKGYFEEEANRLVMLKGAYLDDRTDKEVDKMIIGIGCFSHFLSLIARRGSEMDAAIDEYENTLEELLSEEVSN